MKYPNVGTGSCKRISGLLALCMSAWLVGCAASAPSPAVDPLEAVRSKGYEAGDSIARINNFHLTSWNYVNRKSIIVTASPRHKYLVVFTHPCRNLNSASTLATRGSMGQLSRLDLIYIVDASVGRSGDEFGHHERCAISEIYKLSVLE